MPTNSSNLPSIALGSDHAGFRYKELVKDYLSARGHAVRDFGTYSPARVDYPDFCAPAARAVAAGECDLGIVFGGSGNGEAMTANKIKGIRCGVCWSLDSAQLTKAHNNANIIAIGERLVPEALLTQIVQTWLDTGFEGGRHQPRIDKLGLLGGA
jgi:ribose 5-phosphate isomerase B